MMVTVLVQIPLAMLPVLQIPDATRDCLLEVLTPEAIEERTLHGFDANVRAYAALHRELARNVASAATFEGEGSGFGDELRGAMIAARPQAQQGDFFTSTVAEVIRDRISRALLRGVGGTTLRLYEPLAGEAAPEVNGQFPLVRGVVEWPTLFVHLPKLPGELGYALWGRDLVLIDVPASLVLDVLPEALPDGAHPGVVYP